MVQGYKMNAVNGELTALEGSPFTPGEAGPTSVERIQQEDSST